MLFALMGVGFVCCKRKMLTDESIRSLVDILIVIVTPCLIAKAFMRPFSQSQMSNLGLAFVLALAAHIAGIACSFLFRLKDKSRQSVLRFGVIFSNAGFMGIPLEQAVLGDDGVFYGSVYVTVFNILCWSLGLYVMCGSMKDLKWRTLVVNPGTIGLACGMAFFTTSTSLPGFLANPLSVIASLNTPLAMIVIGYYLAKARFKSVVKCKSAYLAAFFRLIAIPGAVALLLMPVAASNQSLAFAILIASAAPCAALNSMLAARYRRDVELSVGLVAGTTIVSILTLPAAVALASALFK